MSLISVKDVDKFDVKLVDYGNSKDFKLNSASSLAPKHEDLQGLAASIAQADEQIVNSAHAKLVTIAEQIKLLQKQAQDVLQKANEDQILAHAACNFEKKIGQTYHLYRKIETDKHYWSMLSIDDHKGEAPRGSEYKGSYQFEFDRTFTKVGTKSKERENLEDFISEMLKSPNKAIGFGPTFTSSA